MFKPLHVLAPDPETVLSMETDELAGILLEYLHLLPPQSRLSLFNFSSTTAVVDGYPREHREALLQAFVDAWQWLEREGLLIPKPGSNNKVVELSERAARLRTAADVAKYRQVLLSADQLHLQLEPAIAALLRGDYDTAVFQALREVEVAVRTAADLSDADVGVALMRKAFEKDRGPLTDQSRVPAEREAMADLFAGAIGLFKEPHSHRNVALHDSVEAIELLILASHLLRIVSTLGVLTRSSDQRV